MFDFSDLQALRDEYEDRIRAMDAAHAHALAAAEQRRTEDVRAQRELIHELTFELAQAYEAQETVRQTEAAAQQAAAATQQAEFQQRVMAEVEAEVQRRAAQQRAELYAEVEAQSRELSTLREILLAEREALNRQHLDVPTIAKCVERLLLEAEQLRALVAGVPAAKPILVAQTAMPQSRLPVASMAQPPPPPRQEVVDAMIVSETPTPAQEQPRMLSLISTPSARVQPAPSPSLAQFAPRRRKIRLR